MCPWTSWLQKQVPNWCLTLDGVFADPSDVSLVEATDEALYLTIHQPYEELIAFQSRLDSKFRRLEAVGSVSLPDEVRGFVLGKQAGLNTAELRGMLTLSGGSRKYDAIKSDMRRLMWDFSKPSMARKAPGGAKGIFIAGDETTEVDENYDDIAVDTIDSWLPDGEISEAEAVGVYLAFQEARARVAARKLSRSYFPHGGGKHSSSSSASASHSSSSSRREKGGGKEDRSLEAFKARARCRLCNELGHWKRERPKQNQARAHFSVIDEVETNVFPSQATAFVVVGDDDEFECESSASSHSRPMSCSDAELVVASECSYTFSEAEAHVSSGRAGSLWY